MSNEHKGHTPLIYTTLQPIKLIKLTIQKLSDLPYLPLQQIAHLFLHDAVHTISSFDSFSRLRFHVYGTIPEVDDT
jgi:hypothetical protein